MPSRYLLPLCHVLAILCIIGTTTNALAQADLPSGRLAMESTSVGLIVGARWGEGTLAFDGEVYPFNVKGFLMPAIGFTRSSVLGVVYGLSDVADIEGRFTLATGGLTVFQGGGSVVMKNQNNVTIRLDSLEQGAELNLGLGSLVIELKEQERTIQ